MSRVDTEEGNCCSQGKLVVGKQTGQRVAEVGLVGNWGWLGSCSYNCLGMMDKLGLEWTQELRLG